MKYKVLIINNETKEERLRDMGDIAWLESSLFWWTEGNFGCDCNRRFEFMRAGNEEITDEIWDLPCTSGKFSVPYAILEDKTKIQIEGESK